MNLKKIQTILNLLTVIFLLTISNVLADDNSKNTLSFTQIAGPLPRTLKASGSPYLVTADIEVPMGKVVTIEAGTILLFKNFSGMHVLGQLIANGTNTHPIVFTSEFDRDYNTKSDLYPNPYDWNGIYIHDNAIGTRISHCKTMYSVYGIISDTKFIKIEDVIFSNNGKSNLVIESNEHFVTDAPYSYSLSLKDATINGVPIKILKDPMAPKRNIFRFGGIALLAGGIGTGIYGTSKWSAEQKNLDYLSDTSNVDNLIEHNSSDWETSRDARNKGRATAFIGYAIGLIGSLGLGFSFTF